MGGVLFSGLGGEVLGCVFLLCFEMTSSLKELVTVWSQVVQLEELLAVRHSVFVVGNAGTGKSKVW